jgi:hypothetical protein
MKNRFQTFAFKTTQLVPLQGDAAGLLYEYTPAPSAAAKSTAGYGQTVRRWEERGELEDDEEGIIGFGGQLVALLASWISDQSSMLGLVFGGAVQVECS